MKAKKGDGTARDMRDAAAVARAYQTAGRPMGLSGRGLLAVKGGSATTTEAYRGTVRGWITWAKDHGRGLGAEALAEYVTILRKEGATASKYNMALYAGKAALLQAAQRAGMPARELALLKGILDSIKGAKQPAPDVQVITPEERKRLLEALPLRVRLVARFLYATGARVSEALAVRCDQVMIDGERAKVRLIKTKGDKDRYVRIPKALLKDIEAEYAGPDRVYLFESRYGQPFTRQYVTREIARAGKRELGRRVGAHVLRHSRATDLYERTRRIKAISELLGHSSVSTTSTYYVRDSFSDDELFNGEDI